MSRDACRHHSSSSYYGLAKLSDCKSSIQIKLAMTQRMDRTNPDECTVWFQSICRDRIKVGHVLPGRCRCDRCLHLHRSAMKRGRVWEDNDTLFCLLHFCGVHANLPRFCQECGKLEGLSGLGRSLVGEKHSIRQLPRICVSANVNLKSELLFLDWQWLVPNAGYFQRPMKCEYRPSRLVISKSCRAAAAELPRNFSNSLNPPADSISQSSALVVSSLRGSKKYKELRLIETYLGLPSRYHGFKCIYNFFHCDKSIRVVYLDSVQIANCVRHIIKIDISCSSCAREIHINTSHCHG
jgi:hypothetical protein